MEFVKVKYNLGCLGKNLGCEKAPDLILENFNAKEVNLVESNMDESIKNISNKEGDFFVGGDHSITYGCFKSFSEGFNNAGILVFDAHPDCYPEDFINHENWLYYLIKDGILKGENVVLVGIRSVSVEELEFLRENKIRYFTMEQIFNNEEAICDLIMEMCREFDGLYLSIDIDVVDPGFAPGTGYLEPGGLSSQQLFYFLGRIKNLSNLKRIDLVEINPEKDINGMTVAIGKKIVNKFIGNDNRI